MKVSRHLRELADKIDRDMAEEASEPMTLTEAWNLLVQMHGGPLSIQVEINNFGDTPRSTWIAFIHMDGGVDRIKGNTLHDLVHGVRMHLSPKPSVSAEEVIADLSAILTPQGGAA